MSTSTTREYDSALRIAAILAGPKKHQQLSIKMVFQKLLILKNFYAGISNKLINGSILAANSLTIYTAASIPRTQETMLCIALIGMPLVFVYTIFIYRVFKGKIILNEHGYQKTPDPVLKEPGLLYI